ncbi:MAG: enoyl-CoA hydratase/isomerase family protein [Pseudonocardiaceae bacterium]
MIETTERDGIAVLRLDNGPVNALDLELLSALPGALAGVAGAPAVVLTGAGRCFSAGVDLKRIVEGGPAYAAEFLPALSTAALALFEHPRPVVAAVNGHALAGGCVLAAACDVRLMAEGTIGLTELAAGVPFPTVALEIMRYATGPAADNLVLTARMMDPAAARALGLIHEVVEPPALLPAALRHAQQLAAIPVEVFALSKQQLRRPTGQRIAATRPIDDPRVLELWSSPTTRQILRDFLTALAQR